MSSSKPALEEGLPPAAAGTGAESADDPPVPSESEPEARDSDGEEEDDDEEEDDEEDDEEDSVTGASELEEEAQYEGQPACGLPPSLVVRRGCEKLTEDDPPKGTDPTKLQRVDTFASFERAVQRSGTIEPLLSPRETSRLEAPPLERIGSMPPEVKEAFAAVSALEGSRKGGAGSSSGNGGASRTNGGMAPPPNPLSSCEPLPVRRVDTMELLLDPIPGPGAASDGAEGARPAKRTKSLES
jgi:hypothetical protein